MISPLLEQHIQCPYCGEDIVILVDCSEPEQEYIEDCQVCCRPMQVGVMLDDDGQPEVHVRSEDDTF